MTYTLSRSIKAVPEALLTKVDRATEQETSLQAKVKEEKTLDGNPAVGLITHYGVIHGILDSIPNGMAKDIMDCQEEVLRELQKRNVKVIAAEGTYDDLPAQPAGATQDDPSRLGALRGLLIDQIFGSKIPEGPLSDMQRRCLYRFGVACVYARFNRDVAVIGVEPPDNSDREAHVIKTSQKYFSKHPGTELPLIYGIAHAFGVEDLQGSKPSEAPIIKRFNYAARHGDSLQRFQEATTPEGEKKALATITNISISTWGSMDSAKKLACVDKVTPDSTTISKDALKMLLLSKLDPAKDSGTIGKVNTHFKEDSGPFAELTFRKGGPSVSPNGTIEISWDDVTKMNQMGKLTVLAVTEWHGPTQEQILRLAPPNTFSPVQFASLLTEAGQREIVNNKKLFVDPSRWGNDPKALLDVLVAGAKTLKLKEDIKALFSSNPKGYPFSEFK